MSCLPHPGRAGNQITAAAGDAGCWTVIPSWDTAMEQVVWQNERLRIAAPAALDVATPGSILIRAVTNTTMQHTAVVTLPETQTRTCAHRINA